MQPVNLIAPINQLGYGIAGLNILLSLRDHYRVALFPIGPPEYPPEHREAYQRAVAEAGEYDGSAPSLRIWMQGDLAEHVGRGKRIGFPFFELDPLTRRERWHMNSIEHVVVASDWAKGVCERSGVTVPISVAPLGVDRTIFYPGAAGTARLDSDFTVFCNVGKWEVRKGHDVLLRAFNRAFEPTDKVSLRLLCHNPFIRDRNAWWEQRYKASKIGRNIHIEPVRVRSQKEVARFMAACDCGVFPAHAEGWNLDLLECMSCGLHCIATDYSAHTQFCTTSNCRLIQASEREPAFDGLWFHGQGEWAKLGMDQEDQLVEHLREVHRLKQTGQLSELNEAGIETAEQFNWQNTARVITETFR